MYKKQKLEPEAIKSKRNDEQSESIVQSIRMKLLELKIQQHQAPETISALLQEASPIMIMPRIGSLAFGGVLNLGFAIIGAEEDDDWGSPSCMTS